MFKSVEWIGKIDGYLRLLDQTRLPAEEAYLDVRTTAQLAEAVKTLRVRGAPAIGIAAAFGVVLGLKDAEGASPAGIEKVLNRTVVELASTRPTAVNLWWALERTKTAALSALSESADAVRKHALHEAKTILDEDRRTCRAIGLAGAQLVPHGATILTHCNAGALATADFGTALGVIRTAHNQGKDVKVIACETRPLLQGARLTAWELAKDGIDVRLICDSAAGGMLRSLEIDLAITGADRIALSGDTANKIGTYTHAVCAKENGVPFYIAAPISTIDFSISSGDDIPIEFRDEEEVTSFAGHRVAPEGIRAVNPAFDVTPAEYITAIITEKGAIFPPYLRNLGLLKKRLQGPRKEAK